LAAGARCSCVATTTKPLLLPTLPALQKDFVFKGHATEAGTGAYAKALVTTVGVNHFNRVRLGVEDASKPGSARES
jgi:hypothetical protein